MPQQAVLAAATPPASLPDELLVRIADNAGPQGWAAFAQIRRGSLHRALTSPVSRQGRRWLARAVDQSAHDPHCLVRLLNTPACGRLLTALDAPVLPARSLHVLASPPAFLGMGSEASSSSGDDPINGAQEREKLARFVQILDRAMTSQLEVADKFIRLQLTKQGDVFHYLWRTLGYAAAILDDMRPGELDREFWPVIEASLASAETVDLRIRDFSMERQRRLDAYNARLHAAGEPEDIARGRITFRFLPAAWQFVDAFDSGDTWPKLRSALKGCAQSLVTLRIDYVNFLAAPRGRQRADELFSWLATCPRLGELDLLTDDRQGPSPCAADILMGDPGLHFAALETLRLDCDAYHSDGGIRSLMGRASEVFPRLRHLELKDAHYLPCDRQEELWRTFAGWSGRLETLSVDSDLVLGHGDHRQAFRDACHAVHNLRLSGDEREDEVVRSADFRALRAARPRDGSLTYRQIEK